MQDLFNQSMCKHLLQAGTMPQVPVSSLATLAPFSAPQVAEVCARVLLRGLQAFALKRAMGTIASLCDE